MDNTTSSNTQSSTEEQSPVYRPCTSRPAYNLSVRLFDTYKNINRLYYEAKAKRQQQASEDGAGRGGVNNGGYDNQNYDYILVPDEIFADRYLLKHRVGKGSFGQVICAYDQRVKSEVAIKIIKSRRPFTNQARTEIELLEVITTQDSQDEYNIVRLLNQFTHRNHQCIVFEMLSFNLYELLKNTQFKGVSLNLIRKFSKQILKSLEFLSSASVNVIHCDIKPENILLRHPRRSGIKLIDFGSSCYSTNRPYTYIQSRFYRSPEILLGLPYDQKIDIWSLGCVLVEMHTGEPLFGGSDQGDQMCRIVDTLGMPPIDVLEASPQQTRSLFFDRFDKPSDGSDFEPPNALYSVELSDGSGYFVLKRPQARETPNPRTLEDIVGLHIGGPHGRRGGELGHSQADYLSFLRFVRTLLAYRATDRSSPTDATNHPYMTQEHTAPPVEDAKQEP